MSSGSRGPPSGRYGNEYDYDKLRRKPFYPPSNRRDFTSPSTAPAPNTKPVELLNTPSDYPKRPYGSQNPPVGLSSAPPSRGSYSRERPLSGPTPGSYGSYSSGSKKYHYSNYPPSSNGKPEWRGERKLSGGPHVHSPQGTPTQSPNSYNRLPSGLYSEFPGRWKNSYPSTAPSRPTLPPTNRASLTGSVSRPRDRVRGSSSLTKSVKRGDTYYPSRNYSKNVDRYSTRRPDSQNSLVGDFDEDKPNNSDESDDDANDQYQDKPDDDEAASHQHTPEPELESRPETPVLKLEPLPEPVTPVELLSENSTRQYPLTRLEAEYDALVAAFEADKNPIHSKYSRSAKSFNEYPFYRKNLRRFFNNKDAIVARFRDHRLRTHKKKLSLWKTYTEGSKVWEETSAKMEEQLRLLHPPDDEHRKELEAINIRPKTSDSSQVATPSGAPPSSGRRSRRHGDLVTTEAEFQEILKSLEKQDEEDPIIKASKVAAKIPDLILDPVERDVVKFMDSNNLVTDHDEWTKRVKTDFINNFSEQEQVLFCEAFCRYPKRFGAISRFMGGLRTVNECVIHYYITKKDVNYKYLVAQYKKKSSKKSSRRPKTTKSRNPSQTGTPGSTPSSSARADDETQEKEEFAPLSITPPEQEDDKKRVAPPLEGDKKRKRTEETVPLPPVPSGMAQALPQQYQQKLPIQPAQLAAQLGPYDDHRSTSSYWSITEATMFPSLLMEFGTKWTAIADRLTSKTATMVRNYYQRNAEKNGWTRIAEDADKRLEARYLAATGHYPVPPTAPTNGTFYHYQPMEPLVPVGTFQHQPQPVNRLPIPEQFVPVQPAAPPPGRNSISSLLTSDTPAPPPNPTKALIMSLLNSDTPTKPVLPPTKSSLNALLNSPSQPSRSNISTLLADSDKE